MKMSFLTCSINVGTAVAVVILAVVILLIIASCIKIVPQARAVVLERLGADNLAALCERYGRLPQ